MTESKAYEILTGVFREVFGDDSIELRPTSCAKDIEEWDSFTNLTLIVSIENRFDIKLRTTEIEGLQTVGDLVRVIVARAA